MYAEEENELCAYDFTGFSIQMQMSLNPIMQIAIEVTSRTSGNCTVVFLSAVPSATTQFLEDVSPVTFFNFN